MKFATDEQVLKTYNYATVGKVSDTLTVTNKRVILSTEGKLNDGSKIHTTDEMMLESVERVSSALATRRNVFFLILTILFAAAGVALFALTKSAMGFAGLGVALIFLLVFVFYKDKSFYLVLTSGIYEGMDISVSVGNWQRKKSKKAVKVRVDENIASELIDEIGSIIVEAKKK